MAVSKLELYSNGICIKSLLIPNPVKQSDLVVSYAGEWLSRGLASLSIALHNFNVALFTM